MVAWVDEENADLVLVFQCVTAHNRDTTPIQANVFHFNTLCGGWDLIIRITNF
jgi:hypothetical protein